MKLLKKLEWEDQDDIRNRVGSGKLYLQARSYSRVFDDVYKHLSYVINNTKCKLELDIIIASAISSLKLNNEGLTYSRTKSTYSDFNKRCPKNRKVSYKRMFSVLDVLESAGYIVNYSGFKDCENNASMPATIIFTSKFKDIFDNEDLDRCGVIIKEQSVVVKNSDGTLSDKGIPNLKNMCSVVDNINDWLMTYDFNFGVLDKKFLIQRVFKFKKGSDVLGAGRFYFGVLQCIMRGKRKFFKINRECVTEKDYSSNHMMLIAEKEGVILPQDFKPYNVDISDLISCDDESKIRPILKFCCMLLLNSGTAKASFTKSWKENIALIDKFITKGDWKSAQENMFYGVSGLRNAKFVVQRVKEHNSYAEKYFGVKHGSWDTLQLWDSNILLNTMLMMKDANKPFIPYHDSLVCRKSDGEYLEYCMRESWKLEMGSNNNCRIDTKF